MEHPNKNTELIINYFNAISGNEKTRELCEQYTTDEKLIEHIEFFESAFPKYELLIEEIMSEGAKVLVRGRAIGKNTGEFNNIPATGESMNLPFAIRYIVHNNMITDHWLIADQMTLMEQLGIIASVSTEG